MIFIASTTEHPDIALSCPRIGDKRIWPTCTEENGHELFVLDGDTNEVIAIDINVGTDGSMDNLDFNG
jgi:hypothetical protein